MPDTLPLRCSCGALTGRVLDAQDIPRNVCHCRGCQAWAHKLDRQGAMLDAAGGTDLFQITPSQLRIDRGADQLRVVRLTEKGALRWYTACCQTPIANSLDQAWVPWLALQHVLLDADVLGLDSRSADIGPTAYKIHARNALVPVEGGHPTGPISLVLNTLWHTLIDTAKGRARPTPFFDEDGAPTAELESITESERDALGLGKPRLPVPRRKALGCG
jgi:hypothetical protein